MRKNTQNGTDFGKSEIPTEETRLNLKETTVEKKNEEDGIFWINGSNVVGATDRGIYFFEYLNAGTFLTYYDYAADRTVYVCNRADCNHNDADCDAFFDSDLLEEFYDCNSVTYYDGNLYVVGYDEDRDVCLYKISPDGSARENCMKLYGADFTDIVDGKSAVRNWTSPSYCIHRGYIYYIIDEDKPALRRKKLGSNAEAEIITQPLEENSAVYRMEPAGDYVFFQQGEYINDFTALKGGLYAYNVLTGEVTLVKDGLVCTYMISGKTLYYMVLGEGIHKYSLEDGEDVLVVETEGNIFDFYVTDDKIVFLVGTELYIYDLDGSLLGTYGDDRIISLNYVDNEYVFAGGVNEDLHEVYLKLDLKEWNDNSVCWEEIGLE